MGLLERFEDSLDRLVNGAFARAFKSEVQPVELAAALQREMDDRCAVVDRDRTVVPNVFTVELSDHDYQRLAVFNDEVCIELAGYVQAYADQQGYLLIGSPQVHLGLDHELETGLFRVRSDARADVQSRLREPAVITNQPRLVIDDVSYPLLQPVTRLGRSTDSDIRIDDPAASRHHCEVVLGQAVLLRDLNSTNGTYVADRKVAELPLVDGTTIRIGSTEFTYRDQ
ncbi:MAG: FHA domain-containing protein [Actinomycetales bacterium]|nr:FHA domain-containing protein [Actinomycetales bacterium]